nr:reverse transcriptase domain-containing protein [Tanacetum cinerariifolium]
MDKIHRDKRKEAHARLDFKECPKKSRRVREGSQNSSDGTLPARYRNPLERPKMRDRLRYNDGNVFDRLGHRRQNAFDQLSDTYSPSTTKSGPDRANYRDRSHSKGRPRRRDSSPSRDRPRSKDRLCGIEESYGNACSSYGTGARHRYHSRDRDRCRSMKRGRESESPLSRVSESGTSWRTLELAKTQMPNNVKTFDGTGDPEDHVKIFQAATQVERWPMPMWCHMFNSTLIETAKVWFDELPPESINGYKDLKAAFLAYFMQQKKYIKDPVEIHNIKQRERDGETIEDFIERFKTMEEMMTATTAFIRGETVAAFKKKGHTSWKPQDQPKRHVSERRSDFRGQPREGRGSNRGTEGPLVIEMEIGGHMIHCMYVDGGSSMKALGNNMRCRTFDKSMDEFHDRKYVNIGLISGKDIRLSDRKKRPGPGTCQSHPSRGYHQIQMAELDEEKTAFHTSHEVYCYTKMPFGLKNVGATYQRLMNKAFDSQVGRNIEVYIDDLVIKSHKETEMLRDIDDTFRTLRKINMKLNSKKCMFGAMEGIFLGYMISPEGIKPCLDKTEVVLRLPYPRTIKEILANFLVEKPNEAPPDMSMVETPQGPWTLFTNGSSCIDGSGAGLILTSPEGMEFTYALRFQFTASQRVRVLVEVLKEKFIQEKIVATVVEEDGPTWMTPIMEYLKDGPFQGPEKVKFLIVVMDYFTKWIEAKAMATITDSQSNGLVKRANRSLGEGIKARLGEGNKNWIEELPHVLWAHRTMIKSSHGDTSFSLTYETEAVMYTIKASPFREV